MLSLTLRSGATWRSPEGIVISVGEVTPSSAEVQVQVGAAGVDRELPDVAVGCLQGLRQLYGDTWEWTFATFLDSPADAEVIEELERQLRRDRRFRRPIIVDDDSQAQNPDPIKFGRNGSPLSATNTLRGGDTATNLIGVLTYGWSGNAASGNASNAVH